jgi:hypothetical protein
MSSVRRTGSNQRITDALILSGGAATLAVAYTPGVSTWLFTHGATCPLQRAFGWQCPFCGMTHGTVALLHGDIAQVFRTNPFAIVYVVGLALMIASVFGFVWAPFRSTRLQWAKTAVIVGAALAFSAYSIGRNLV